MYVDNIVNKECYKKSKIRYNLIKLDKKKVILSWIEVRLKTLESYFHMPLNWFKNQFFFAAKYC